MKHGAFPSAAIAALMILAASCPGASEDPVDPGLTSIAVAWSPEVPQTGFPVQCTVTVRHPKPVLKQVSVGFSSGNGGRTVQDYDSSEIIVATTTTFTREGDQVASVYVYHMGGELKTKTVVVTAVTPTTLPVSLALVGYATTASRGPCSVAGPPALVSGDFTNLESTERLFPIGVYDRGAPVSIDQSFRQQPSSFGEGYACSFGMRLVAGPENGLIQLGTGTCRTDSTGALTCGIALGGTVP